MKHAPLPTASHTGAPTPSLLRRLACLLYEGLLLCAVVFVAGLLYAVLTDQRDAMQGRGGLLVCVLVLVPGAYLVWHWSRSGQTLPMQTWRIRLTTVDGQRVSRRRAVARYAAGWIWLLPALAVWQLAGWRSAPTLLGCLSAGVLGYALLALLHPQRQFWHDALCGTRLVDTRVAPFE